ncbi:ankyrin repeat domain-containing protein [Aliarcobacter lanthieri]|uniref:ankyrin repeat domain-containing protein n=1 Tax=Aliarcobacter lanthieri TaxID=1355374 RepID=UPI00047B68C5|nr:ankyrin repeat domain-containing protein [Aliarcobacter lanthieri]QKF58362.1 ankyrin domain-containing protein [Aliarcobacter lanthieri]
MCSNIILGNRLNQKSSQEIFTNLIESNSWDILIKMFSLNILDINSRDFNGRNALYWAILQNKTDVIKALVDLRINLYVSPNLLAMNFAVYLDNVKVLRCLKNCGLNIDMIDEINSTPLIYALLYKKQNSIKFLISNGANLEHEDFMGNCAKNLV